MTASDMDLALRHATKNQFADAEAIVLRKLGLNPYDPTAIYIFAFCKAGRGDNVSAEALSSMALDLDPSSYEA